MSTTQASREIKASPEKLYQAFTSPAALEVWMAPGDMTGKIHHFDLREGGSYEMSLFYPNTDIESSSHFPFFRPPSRRRNDHGSKF